MSQDFSIASNVTRERDNENRRLVKATITTAGLALLDQLEGPLRAFHDKQIGHLGDDQLQILIELLAAIRSHH